MSDFNIDKYHDDFYEIQLSSEPWKVNNWRAQAIIRRCDSAEIVDRIFVVDADRNCAEMILHEKISAQIGEYPRPPYQWGRVEIRRLLVDYRNYNNNLTMILVRLQSALSQGKLNEEILHELFWEAREYAEKGSVAFSDRLNKLSDSEKMELLTSSDETYANFSDPASLDDLDGRDALFGFIVNPSTRVA